MGQPSSVQSQRRSAAARWVPMTKARRMHWPGLTPCRQPGLQSGQQAVAEIACGGLECGHHGGWHARIGQKIAPGSAIKAARLGPKPQNLTPGMDCHAARPIHHQQLTIVDGARVLVTPASARVAGRPAASASSTKVPRAGSVTFWLATPPTPLRRHARSARRQRGRRRRSPYRTAGSRSGDKRKGHAVVLWAKGRRGLPAPSSAESPPRIF